MSLQIKNVRWKLCLKMWRCSRVHQMKRWYVLRGQDSETRNQKLLKIQLGYPCILQTTELILQKLKSITLPLSSRANINMYNRSFITKVRFFTSKIEFFAKIKFKYSIENLIFIFKYKLHIHIQASHPKRFAKRETNS